MALIQKIIEGFKKDKTSNYDDQIEKMVHDFYLPYKATMQEIKKEQPLSEELINDYLMYIIHNYYMPAYHDDIITNFAYEWAFHTYDTRGYVRRREEAIQNIKEALKRGKKIDHIDALWISDAVYVDDNILDCKRVITKEFINGKPKLEVKTVMDDYNIMKKVDYLRNRLIELSSSQEVAIKK